jgi:HEAT repeat protein
MNKQLPSYERDARQFTEEARQDPRSTAELIRLAVEEWDSEEDQGEARSTLHYRATREVLDSIAPYCRSEKGTERSVAANVLGHLGIPRRAFPVECSELLVGMLRRESDPQVLHDMCSACAHLEHPDLVPTLVALAAHPEDCVRFGVVFGLTGRVDADSVAALIRLSADSDEGVRDWATFGLGTQIDLDTPAIREALAARLYDPDGPTRGEALVGLAKRRDERVLPALIDALALDEATFGERYDLVLEAADEMADPRLLPALLARREWAPEEAIDWAIERCSGEAS